MKTFRIPIVIAMLAIGRTKGDQGGDQHFPLPSDAIIAFDGQGTFVPVSSKMVLTLPVNLCQFDAKMDLLEEAIKKTFRLDNVTESSYLHRLDLLRQDVILWKNIFGIPIGHHLEKRQAILAGMIGKCVLCSVHFT